MAAADDVVLVEIETELNELMDWTELWINMLFQADQIQKGCFNAEGFYPTPYW
jgi:hypothetical protein